jgi:hypothetical protein
VPVVAAALRYLARGPSARRVNVNLGGVLKRMSTNGLTGRHKRLIK